MMQNPKILTDFLLDSLKQLIQKENLVIERFNIFFPAHHSRMMRTQLKTLNDSSARPD